MSKAMIVPCTSSRGLGYRVAEQITVESKRFFMTKVTVGYAMDVEKGTMFDTIEQALAYCAANSLEVQELQTC